MSDLRQAHDDLNIVWQFFKKYSQIEPKDDYFYSQMAAEANKMKCSTKFGAYALRAALSAISEEDWKKKQDSYHQMEIGGTAV